MRLRGSKRHDKLEFWPKILRSCIHDKHSGGGRFFQQLWAQEMMQIVQDVTSPEFGRLLGKKLVLSRPYLELSESHLNPYQRAAQQIQINSKKNL